MALPVRRHARAQRDRLRAAGAQDDEVEEAQRLLRDPAIRVVTATAWLGTGRTPGA